ncbi:MAG TPA: DUF4129 domain-containing protein [Acidothermaceae bacterium]|jgi:hypothetical protein
MWGWLAVSPSPNPVTRGSAQAAARAELSKRAYHRNDPSVVDRGLEWLLKRLQKALDASTRHAPGHGVGLFLIIVIVAAVVALIVVRVGALRRTARASDQPIFGFGGTTADDHRKAAAQFAADGLWAEAIRERLRAVARELEQRGVLDPRPGRTAAELSREAGTQLPALADDLRIATSIFDEVWYGGRTATAADEELLRRLDARVAGSHRGLVGSA